MDYVYGKKTYIVPKEDCDEQDVNNEKGEYALEEWKIQILLMMRKVLMKKKRTLNKKENNRNNDTLLCNSNISES
jgi:hypothetical protein